MKLCGTCKYWGNRDDEGLSHRACRAVIHDRDCETDPLAGEPIEERDWLTDEQKAALIAIRDRPAVVLDGSGYFAALKTRESFGCILHEELPS